MIIDLATGKIYVRHHDSNPSPITSPKFNVSLGLVGRDALSNVLAERVRACCGVRKSKYRLANINDISIYFTGRLGTTPDTVKEE